MASPKKICQACGSSLSGRKDAKTCSSTCRKRLQRARYLLRQETAELKQVVDKAEDSLVSLEKKIVPVEVNEAGFIGDFIPVTVKPAAPQNYNPPVPPLVDVSAFEAPPESDALDSKPEVIDQSPTWLPVKRPWWKRHKLSGLALSMIAMVIIFGGFSAWLLGQHHQTVVVKPAVAKLSNDLIPVDYQNKKLSINFDTTVAGGKSLSLTGPVVIQNDSDSTGVFKIQTADGNTILAADTLNQQIIIGNKPPGQVSLSVKGDISTNGSLVSASNGYSLGNTGLSLGGRLICTVNGCVAPPTPASQRIDVANLAYLNASQTFSGNNILQGATTQTGTYLFQSAANSTTAFQIQNQAGNNNLLVADTVNSHIGIGLANPSYTLDVNGDINIANNQAYRINGVAVCTNIGCSPSGGSNSYIQLQASTPGSQQSGNANISGNFIIGGQFSGSGLGLTNLDASQLATGTVNDLRLSNNVTLQGNNFNGASQLIQTTNLSYYPSLNGSLITNLNASAVSSGTLDDLRLAIDVPLTGANNNFSGTNSFTNVVTMPGFKTTNNTHTINVGFTNISTGNLTFDFDLSSTPGTYTICTVESGNCTAPGTGIAGMGTIGRIAKFIGTQTLADSIISDDGTTVDVAGNFNATAVTQNNNTVCDVSGNCAGVGGQVGTFGSPTAGTIALFHGSATIENSILTQSGSTVTSTGNLNVTSQYQIGGVQVTSAILSNDGNLAKLNASQAFTGNNTFSGTVSVQPATDSTSDFQVKKSSGGGGTPVLTVDTTNSRVGIGNIVAAYTLDVAGDVNISTGSAYRINGVAICGPSATCAPSSGSNNYVQNGVSTQTSANFNIESTATGSAVGVLQGKNNSGTEQTADLLDLKDGTVSHNTLVSFGNEGQTLFKDANSGGHGSFFEIQDNSSNSLFKVNTSADQITILGTTNINNSGSASTNIAVSGTGTLGLGNTTGATTLTGASGSSSIGFGNFTVSTAGAIVGVGVNSGSGLLQGTGGLTLTGTTNINNSGTASTSIGASATGGTITIGNTSGTDLVLQDAQWGVLGNGNATFAQITNNGTYNGNTLTNTRLAFSAGSTGTVDSAASQQLSLGDTNATGVNIGNTTNTAALLLQGTAAATYTIGTSGNTGGITLGNSTATNEIDIGNANTADTKVQTIKIGAGSGVTTGKSVVTVGSTANASSLTLQAGSAGISLTGATTVSGNLGLGANNLTLTGDIASSGTRAGTGYFTGLNVSSTITGSISGNAATVTGLSVTSGKTLSVLKTMSFTSADDTGVYTLPTGTATLLATNGSIGSLTGTISSTVLGSSSLFVGTTSIALNRASASLALTGITSIDGNAATATALQNARTIGGVSFNGTANITVASATGGFAVSGGAFSANTSIGTGVSITTATPGLNQTGGNITLTAGGATNALISGSVTIDAGPTSSNNGGGDISIGISNANSVTIGNASSGVTIGGTLALGTNSMTLTGAIAATGARSSHGWFTALDVTNTITGAVSGNAGTATTLQTARTINGTSFNGSANITVTAAAGTLTGATLNSTVTASSLTSVGTLTSLTVSGASTIASGANATIGNTTLGNSNSTTLQAGSGGISLTTAPSASGVFTSGAISILTGVGTGSNAGSGNITMDVGTSGTAANQGTISIGTANATGIQIGSSRSGGIQVYVSSTTSSHGVCRDITGAGLSTLQTCTSSPGADYAELYPTETTVGQGDIVMPNGNYVTSKDGKYQLPVLKQTQTGYDSGTIGVISEQNLANSDGLATLTGNNVNSSDDPQALALNGRVLTKVDTENGNIMAGDYITASSTPGVGMKATHAGEVVGRALASYSGSGVSQILVFINPSYYNPDNNMQGDSGTFDLVTANSITVNTLTVNRTATFNGSIVVNGHIIGNPDTSGVVSVSAGASSLIHTFSSSFDSAPNVVISPENDPGGLRYWVTKDQNSFTVHLSGAAASDIKFDYFVQQ